MKALRFFAGLSMTVLSIAPATPALGLANRVFVSARSGNDANSCDDVNTPCQTFAGAVLQVVADGAVIVLDSGGYGPVTITKGVTIEARGVTAFIHPPSGDAITVNAGSSTVTLRGLTLLNVAPGNGITVNSAGTLNVENCFMTGFSQYGIQMLSGGRLNVKETDIQAFFAGVALTNATGVAQVSMDHCHLSGNTYGYIAQSTFPGSSSTTATFTVANNNFYAGWVCGNGTSGKDVLNLEFCAGSENRINGLAGNSTNAQSVVRYSNCVFADNGVYGVARNAAETLESRGNNTITGNGTAPTFGTIGSFSPM